MNNRRKPSKSDFNHYYFLLKTHLKDESFTNIELFNELAIYFSDNIFNMFKLLDNKWKKYLDYCDRFLFMCPYGVIKPEQIPRNIGLIWVNLKNGAFYVKQSPGELKPKYLNGGWLRTIYKRLLFRKYAKVDGQFIELEGKFFDN